MIQPVKFSWGDRTLHLRAEPVRTPGETAFLTACLVPSPCSAVAPAEILRELNDALGEVMVKLGPLPATRDCLVAIGAELLPWFRQAEERGLLNWTGDGQEVLVCDCAEASRA